MPNIREYTNTEALQPSDRGVSATVFAARHIESQYAQIGQQIGSGIAAAGDAYTRIKEQQDLSHGFVALTALQAQKTQELQTALKTADPNDPTVAAKFASESLDPDIEKFVSGFSTENGRKWAVEAAGHMREGLVQHAVGAQSQLAGAAVVGNLDASLNNLSATAFLDPASRDRAYQTWVAGIDAQLSTHPTLSAEDAATVREKYIAEGRKAIGLASVQGAARANPVGTVDAIAKGSWNDYLSGEELAHATSLAETVQRMQKEDARSAQNDSLRNEKIAANTEMTTLYGEGIGKGPNGTWAPPPNYSQRLLDVIQRHPTGVDMGEAHAAQNMVSTYNEDTASGRLVMSDPKTFTDMSARTSIPPGQPGALSRAEIFQAAADRKLSNHDAAVLADGIEKSNDPAHREMQKALTTFIESKKALVLGQSALSFGGSGPSPEGQERYYQFETAIRNAVDVGLAHGQAPDFIIQHQLNPASPDYLGKQDSLWMKFYATGQLPTSASLPRPAASSPVAAPAVAGGQAPAAGSKLSDDQVKAMIFGK